MLQIPLQSGPPGADWACLRCLCGHDEMAIEDTSTQSASDLLNRLLVQVPGTNICPGKAQDLAVSDHDLLLVAIYRYHYGDHIEANTLCASCTESFDLSFSAGDLLVDLKSNADGVRGPDEKGIYALENGLRFRLPTPSDQIRLTGLEAEMAKKALLECCVVDAVADFDPQSLEKAMLEVGPFLTTVLSVTCPYCDSEQQITFDIQSHLLRVMIGEKRWLTHEVHRLAVAYGWSLPEILDLPREDRRAYVRLVLAERSIRRDIH